VDPYGQTVFASGLFVEGAWTADVRLISERTFYGVYGDWVVWLSLALTGLALASTLTMPRRHDGTRA
jgi:apolipoprotein N-acyltransferase